MHKKVFCTKKINFLKAFTLAELVMSIVVASVIMLATAPIITKRINDDVTLSTTKTKGVLFLVDPSGALGCQIQSDIEDGVQQEDCSFQIPRDVTQINAVIVGNGGNGSNARAADTFSRRRASWTYELLQPTAIPINRIQQDSSTGELFLAEDLKIDFMAGGGAGGGAGYGKKVNEPQSQEDCNELAGQNRDEPASSALTLFIPASMNGNWGKNFCVTKYNVGDGVGGYYVNKDFTAGTSGVTIRTNCTSSDSSYYCCWTNQTTSDDCTSSGSWSGGSSTYSGCNRTVCNFYAAEQACKGWAPTTETAGKWRLPKQSEMAGWKTQIAKEKSTYTGIISQYLGYNGLQLCDYSSTSYGAIKCDRYDNGCSGAHNNDCDSSNIWGADGYYFYLDDGSFAGPYSNSGWPAHGLAYSVRCVIDEKPNTYVLYSGSGGNSGSSIVDYWINQGILEDDILLEVQIGAGGAGGTKDGETPQGGQNTILKYNDTTITALGSSTPGKNATEAGPGVNEENIKNTFHIDRISANRETTTEDQPEKQGGDGDRGSIDNIPQGGDGGQIQYLNGNFEQGGPGGSNLSNEHCSYPPCYNGQPSATSGGGGGGGSATVTSGTLNVGNGANGANGEVTISYYLRPLPAAGAGGAGGGMIIGRNISVNEEDIISVSFNPTTLSIGTSFKLEAASGENASQTTVETDGDGNSSFVPGFADPDGGIIINALNRPGNFQIKPGKDGEYGTRAEGLITMLGGTGGVSGTGASGGCGGMNIYYDRNGNRRTNNDKCINSATNSTNGSEGTFNVLQSSIVSNSFGLAGSGGGGGGFQAVQGDGGQGANGYVYVWWVEE